MAESKKPLPSNDPIPPLSSSRPFFARDAQGLFDKLDRIDARPMSARSPEPQNQNDVDDEIAREQRIKNDDAEQDIRLKKLTLRLLFIFLGLETFVVFLFSYFQAVNWPYAFQLDAVSFRILIGATIAQINGMLFVAVRYLFPTKSK